MSVRLGRLGVLALLATGCSDRIEASFDTHADAKSRGAFGPGKWLPEWIPASATDIREEHDLDTNEMWITFSFQNDLNVPPSCLSSATPKDLAEQAPRWWRRIAEAMEAPIRSYKCREETELGGYWARGECTLLASPSKAAYRCSSSRLEPKTGGAQQAPTADAGNPRG
jgi:hypothetical protein